MMEGAVRASVRRRGTALWQKSCAFQTKAAPFLQRKLDVSKTIFRTMVMHMHKPSVCEPSTVVMLQKKELMKAVA